MIIICPNSLLQSRHRVVIVVIGNFILILREPFDKFCILIQVRSLGYQGYKVEDESNNYCNSCGTSNIRFVLWNIIALLISFGIDCNNQVHEWSNLKNPPPTVNKTDEIGRFILEARHKRCNTRKQAQNGEWKWKHLWKRQGLCQSDPGQLIISQTVIPIIWLI